MKKALRLRSGQKGFIAPVLILVGVLVLATLVTVAFWFGKNYSSKSTTPTIAPPPAGGSTPDETANWNTYSDPKNRFSFKYPTGAEVSSKNATLESGPNVEELVATSKGADEWYEFSIKVESNPTGQTSQDYVNKIIADGVEENTPAKIIADKVKKTMKPYNSGEVKGVYMVLGFDYDFATVVQNKNNNMYIFTITGVDGVLSNSTSKFLDQILSTFKFK